MRSSIGLLVKPNWVLERSQSPNFAFLDRGSAIPMASNECSVLEPADRSSYVFENPKSQARRYAPMNAAVYSRRLVEHWR